MNILFIHPNFPGQYLHLAQYFARSGEHKIFFLTKQTNGNKLVNVNLAVYKNAREGTKGIHPYAKYLEDAVLDGQAVARALVEMKEKVHFVPDVVIGHTGWGSMLYVKDIYPDVPLIGYFEWHYRVYGSDVCYWKNEQINEDGKLRIRTQNAHHLVNLTTCDVCYTPTQWQKKQFPPEFQSKLRVLHEGVDTEFCQPRPGARLVLPGQKLDLSGVKEIVTYVSRGFEPYRGFPQFMAAVRLLLRRRPKCHVVLVGADKNCYGPAPAPDKTWKQVEVEKGGYDKSRVHFVGHLQRDDYRTVLQASTVHVYLTRPFVLSWSMLESMSFGNCLVASATPPVEEVVEDGVNGLLVNFRSPEHIVNRIEEAFDDEDLRKRLGRAARETVLARYDRRDCVRRQIDMIYQAMK